MSFPRLLLLLLRKTPSRNLLPSSSRSTWALETEPSLGLALPKNDGRGALAEIILREATGHLSAPIQGTARCAQNRARLVRALYERMDRLTEPLPAAT